MTEISKMSRISSDGTSVIDYLTGHACDFPYSSTSPDIVFINKVTSVLRFQFVVSYVVYIFKLKRSRGRNGTVSLRFWRASYSSKIMSVLKEIINTHE